MSLPESSDVSSDLPGETLENQSIGGQNALLNKLAGTLSTFGLDMAEIAGAIEVISTTSHTSVESLQSLHDRIHDVETSAASITERASVSENMSDSIRKQLDGSRSDASQTLSLVETLLTQVGSITSNVSELNEAMEDVRSVLDMIDQIAKQTNLLALNATIEAARAGDAGKGFAIVAAEVKTLARNTSDATGQIDATIGRIKTGLDELNQRVEDASGKAQAVGDSTGTLNSVLEMADQAISQMESSSQEIGGLSANVSSQCEQFIGSFDDLATQTKTDSEALSGFSGRIQNLADATDELVLDVSKADLDTQDSKLVKVILEKSAEISALFEAGVRDGKIAETALFDYSYEPIAGTDPQQFMTPFTSFTDEVLPPIQEAIVALDSNIVFSACVDVNGHLPTHNLKFSQPQGDDPVWNAANCRNRRTFDDRAGLRAGQNEKPVLLQTYRRDMGGGKFVILKELDAPIRVNGRRWGTIRLAYKI